MLSAAKFLCRSSKPVLSLRRFSVPAKDREIIGCREVVGSGKNNMLTYLDHPEWPCPAIRFLADNPYLQALREKERGDWKSLTIEEKKCLYRASFCQTYSEMRAPTGEWKTIVGSSLFFIGLALWMVMFVKRFVLPQEMPITFELERQQAQLKRMLDIQVNPITGLASKWDYEKEEWKKTGWFWE